MRISEAERERELDTAIALREREIAALEDEKRALQADVHATAPALRGDGLLMSFPVLDCCVKKPRVNVLTLPIEHVSNTLQQLSIAQQAIEQQNKHDATDVQRLRARLREQQSVHAEWAAKTRHLSEQSGIDAHYLSAKARTRLLKQTGKRSSARGRSREEQQHQHEEDGGGDGEDRAKPAAQTPSLAELQARQRIVRQELKLAKQLLERKSRTVVAFARQVDERRGIIDEIDELYNSIRVADRDIRAEEEALARLRDEDAAVEAQLQAKADAQMPTVRSIVEREVADLRDARYTAIAHHREPQERVLKAQDYRLTQLDSRLAMVDKALLNSHLMRDVENILAELWNEHAIDVPMTSLEQYNMERIIPAQEKVHPGVYNLFLTEKERLTRTVSVLNIGIKEKQEVLESLACQADALAGECNGALQELDDLAASAAYAEEQQRGEAVAWVQRQRDRYKELCTERQRVYHEYLQQKQALQRTRRHGAYDDEDAGV